MKATHRGERIYGCPACITAAQKMKAPWHDSYLDVWARVDNAEENQAKLHREALRRSAKNQAMRDCGLVRVRGALGGIYWE